MDSSHTPGGDPPSGFPLGQPPAGAEVERDTREADPSSKERMHLRPIRLDSSISPASSGPRLVQPAPRAPQPRSSLWMARISLVIEVMVWIEFGIILVIVPWTRTWSENSLLVNYPQLHAIVAMNFTRGAVAGVGLLDLWTGIWRALNHKDLARG